MKKVICCICEKKFVTDHHHPDKYCSSECRNQSLKEHKKKYNRRHSNEIRLYRETVKSRYSCLKAEAKRRGFVLEFDIVVYSELVKDKKCSYCGGPLPPTGYGLDRLDNKKGYEFQNVTACCTSCNGKKGALEGIGFTYPRNVELLKELIESEEVKEIKTSI